MATNSSPPMRARVSVLRKLPRMRAAGHAAGEPEPGQIGSGDPGRIQAEHPVQTGVGVLDRSRRQRHHDTDRDLLDDLRKIVSLPGHGCAPAVEPESAADADRWM